MRRPALLPKTRTTLRWMFRGTPSLGYQVLRTAEMAARDDLGPSAVLNAVIDRHGWIPADALLELWAALEADMPLDDLGALVLHGMQLRATERAMVS